MYSPSRGPERLIRFGQWLIALLFAYFLIQVGASLIADLPLLAAAPRLEQFLDKAQVERLEAELRPLSGERDQLRNQLLAVRQRQNEAQESYDNAKAGFENWRAARSATEQSAQNPEVISRVRQLDAQLETQRRIGTERRELERRIEVADQRIASPEAKLQELRSTAQSRWDRARQGAERRAFLIRLLFVGPVLALAIWQFRRFRGSDQWPFVWGFLLFGLFAFFFELVPYLPSFGAYIRYGVGALLTFVGGRAISRGSGAIGRTGVAGSMQPPGRPRNQPEPQGCLCRRLGAGQRSGRHPRQSISRGLGPFAVEGQAVVPRVDASAPAAPASAPAWPLARPQA